MSESETVQEPLDRALDDLQKAEEHLEKTHVEELAAECEVEEAIKEIEEAKRDEVVVHVVHVHEVEHAAFEEKRTATLQQVWDKAYKELHIERQPKDVFQTGGDKPKSLMSDLGLTLKEAIERKVIENYHFGIASETGGA